MRPWLLYTVALAAFACSDQTPLSAGSTSVPVARVSVLTRHDDNARSGANLHESQLTPSVLRSGAFGPLFTLFVDGFVYAQPLVATDVDLGAGGVHDVVYVATEHDSLYAFDANSGAPLWQRSFGRSSNLVCFPQLLLTPEIGITGTPVIDPVTRTIYFVAYTEDDPASCAPSNFHQTLWAVDMTSGDPVAPPVEVTASAPIVFDPVQELQRTALLLSNGVLYFAFASHGGIEPYHGWMFAYDATTLAQLDRFVTTPSGRQGGIWMGGEGPSSGEGDLFFTTGNGTWNGRDDWADSLLRMRLADGRLRIVDFFTPYNQAELERRDLDLGSTGVLLVPGTHTLAGAERRLAVIAGKQGNLYLLDRDALGGFHAEGDHVLQTVPITNWNIDGSAVYFDDGLQPRIYVWGASSDRKGVSADLDAFALTDSPTGMYLTLDSASRVPFVRGLPGGMLAVSANGTSDGIVWANHPWSPVAGGEANAITHVVPGVLRAFDATNVGEELWNNRADATAPADSVGDFAKFCPPTIANGKVYFAAWSQKPGEPPGRVIVFGVKP